MVQLTHGRSYIIAYLDSIEIFDQKRRILDASKTLPFRVEHQPGFQSTRYQQCDRSLTAFVLCNEYGGLHKLDLYPLLAARTDDDVIDSDDEFESLAKACVRSAQELGFLMFVFVIRSSSVFHKSDSIIMATLRIQWRVENI